MPINQIEAASYAKVHYSTVSRPQGHDFRFYFDAVPDIDGDGAFVFPTYTDTDHLTGWLLSEICEEIYGRLGAVGGGVPPWSGVHAEMWAGVDGDNEFLGIDGGSYEGLFNGVGANVASAMVIYNMQSANRQNYRWMTFDGAHPAPQILPGSNPPVIDNDSVAWFFIRSAVGFTTQDGAPLTTFKSRTEGYNRKLARSYGKLVTP